MPKVLQRFNPFTGIIEQRPVYGDHYRYANDPTLSITTSETFQNKLALDVGVLAPGAIYELEVNYKWNHDATNSDFEARVLDETATALDYLDGWHKQEPQDSAGNWEGTGSSQRYLTTTKYVITGASIARSFVLQYRTDDSDDASSIFDVTLAFKRVA